MAKITVKNTDVVVISINDTDYISLTDIAKFKTDDTSAVIGNWMRNRNTIEFLSIWETLYNPNFKPLEFEGFRKEAGLNAFTMSPLKRIFVLIMTCLFQEANQNVYPLLQIHVIY